MSDNVLQLNPDAGIRIEKDVMITMRDGVQLATDIYCPAPMGETLQSPLPVILERTPYDKAGTRLSERSVSRPEPMTNAEVAAYFVKHGYVVIYQDCRGRYGSEGNFQKYLGEGKDGADTIKWIVRQPWCNGRVGTMGLSYSAHTQSALACYNPEGLACMFLDSGGFSNAYQGGIRQGGAFELKQITWAFKHAKLSRYAEAHPEARRAMEKESLEEWLEKLPWKPGCSPLKWVPEYETCLLKQWQHGVFDEFWKQPELYAMGYYDVYADVPMMHMSSWYDPYPRTAIDNYLGLSSRKSGPVRLLLGPWLHGRKMETFVGDVDFGDQATLDNNLAENSLEYRRRWFDCWLKDIGNGVRSEPAVWYFVMGGGSGRKNSQGRLDHGGRWRSATQWPIPGTENKPYYLSKGGDLTAVAPDVGEAFLSFQHDPANPVPSVGGAITSGAPIMEGGAFDQREDVRFWGCSHPGRALADRDDILVFKTAPLSEPVEITGQISVKLWITSDCPDTDFTAKLIDLYPPSPDYPKGFAMNITDGILRARYRDSWEKPVLMEPGTVYPITIDLFPTSNLFQEGHCIRLDIAGSNFPHFDVNPNTGEPEGLATHQRVATNTVFMEIDRPSHVVFPIAPKSS